MICIMLLVVTLLAACMPSASPTPVTDPSRPVAKDGETDMMTLRFAVFDWNRGQYAGMIEAFEAENPEVRIKTVSIEGTLGLERGKGVWPDDAFLLLASAADVIDLSATRKAVQQGALLDLTPFIETDPNLAPEDFYPNMLASFQWQGGVWSMPTRATYHMINYNQALFDAAGVAYPQPGWTWDDFLATAQALTLREGDSVTQWGFVQPQVNPIPFVQARAGTLFDPETDPPTANLDSPAVVEAVRWYADLFLDHKVSPYNVRLAGDADKVFYEDKGSDLVWSGQAAMWLGEVEMKRAQLENIGVVPFPVGGLEDNVATTPVTVAGLSVSRGTNKADLAWQWVSFLSHLSQQRSELKKGYYFGGANIVPALPSVAAAGGFWDNLDAGPEAALRYAIDHAYVDTYGGAGYGAFYNAVVDIIENGTEVETALANAQVVAEDEIEIAVSTAPTPVPDLAVAAEEEAAINAGAVVIKFGIGDDWFAQQTYRDLVPQFQEVYPDILVEIEVPQDCKGSLDVEGMAAEYDCFQNLPDLSSDAARSAILSVEPFIASDATISKEDFYASVLEQFTYQGQVWGLPGRVTVNVMNYNKDLFDAAGLDYPSLDWTTNDFLHLATALTQGEGEDKQYGYLPGYDVVRDLIATIDRLGGDMYDDSVDPPRTVFNSRNVIEAVRWYTSLPAFVAQAGDDYLNEEERPVLIAQGRVAIWGDPWGKLETQGLNVGVAPLPLGPHSAEGSSFESVNGFFISAETDARQACWNWIAFLSQQPTALGLPARQEVAESNAYRQAVGTERADAYIASINSGSKASFMQRMSDEGSWLLRFSFGWLANAYDRIVAGDMTVEEAMNAAQEGADVYRDCAITNNAFQPADWGALMACYEEANAAVPDLAGGGN